MTQEPAVTANKREAEVSPELDWTALANQRLNRLVRVEHDCAVMRDRLERLRSEHDALLLINDSRLKQWHALRKSAEQDNQAMTNLAARCAAMETSRSWRITAPLRNFSTRARRARSFAFAAVRWVLRSTRLSPAFSRIAPALHARARSRLYP